MSRLALFLSAGIAAATGAASQELTVRSGEHEGYTRLVVQVPSGTDWVLKQSKNGASLNVELDNVTFQTGSVFQRLSGNRLAALSQSEPGAALELEFGCECTAQAFMFRNSMIVMDIAPGTYLPPITSDIPPPATIDAPVKETPPVATEPLDALALPLLNLNAHGFQEQLSTRLLQGVDRGIVDLDISPVGPRASIDRNPLVPADMELNIAVTSVLDSLNGLLGPDVPQLVRRPPCVSTAELAFDTWSEDRPFAEQSAALRSGLFQEFDIINSENALKLAKLYAHSGFGAESIAALTLLEQPNSETDRIAAIARVLDHGPLADDNPFQDLQRCDSDAAMWAVLTEGMLHSDANLIAIEQSFARLPDHLRRHVGPALSDILVDARKLESARRVLRSVDRVETQKRPGTTQAKAKVATAEGDSSQSEALLTEVISASDAALEAPLALERLVDQRWHERGSVSPQELELAAAYVVEFRRSEIGQRMQRTQAIALVLGQEFDAALTLLSDMEDDPETVNRVAMVLTERADDATFLRRVLTMPAQHSMLLTTDTAVAVANRLAQLGFAQPAHRLAKRPQDSIRRGERARLRAQAALLDRRPHQAILELTDDTTDEGRLLQAKALQLTGAYASAGDLMRDSGDANAANRLFWLADKPEKGDVAEKVKYSQVIQTSLGLASPPAREPEKPLADAAGLLEDSERTRRMIADLFSTLEQE